MRIGLPTVLIAGMGGLLLWCGITDRSPIDVVKAVLTGQEIPPRGSGSRVAKIRRASGD